MKTLAERFTEARTAAGLSQGALAKLAKCGQSTIASIERGRNQGSTVIPRVAEVLNVSALWLAEGRGPRDPQPPTQLPHEIRHLSDTAPQAYPRKPLSFEDRSSAPDVHHVPVITWETALMLHGNQKGVPVTATRSTIYAGEAPAGHKLVALFQDDASMCAISGRQPDFPPGTEYIIDCNAKAQPGDFVLVSIDNRAYLRQLVDDTGTLRLRALAHGYSLPEAARAQILGVLLSARQPLYSRQT